MLCSSSWRQALIPYHDHHLLLLTLVAGPDLVLRGGWLQAGHTYVFRLRATAADGQSGFAQASVRTNHAPRGGRLAIAPAEGMPSACFRTWVTTCLSFSS